MATFEVLTAEQNLSNSDFWSFSLSCVDISGSHSKEQFLGREMLHRRIFSSQTKPGLAYFCRESSVVFELRADYLWPLSGERCPSTAMSR